MTEHLLSYFGAINLVTLLLSLVDKGLAVNRMRALPDRLMLTLAWMGGAAGAKFAQIILAHRTQGRSYTTNLNLIVLFQVCLMAAVWSAQVTSNMQNENVSMLESWMGKDDKPAKPKRFGPGSQEK